MHKSEVLALGLYTHFSINQIWLAEVGRQEVAFGMEHNYLGQQDCGQ